MNTARKTENNDQIVAVLYQTLCCHLSTKTGSSSELLLCFQVAELQSLLIVGSNNISEKSLLEMNGRENEIDVVGVGTHLVTCPLQPKLGCVYKVAVLEKLFRLLRDLKNSLKN
ncbi:UNVERIFIED_CONTAM: hypothetical protein FKN15_062818 [Acipenser sinensis]